MCVVIGLFIAKLNPVGISKCSASNPSRLVKVRLESTQGLSFSYSFHSVPPFSSFFSFPLIHSFDAFALLFPPFPSLSPYLSFPFSSFPRPLSSLFPFSLLPFLFPLFLCCSFLPSLLVLVLSPFYHFPLLLSPFIFFLLSFLSSLFLLFFFSLVRFTVVFVSVIGLNKNKIN
jgi:hypothetical protein